MTNKELADRIEAAMPQVVPGWEPGLLVEWPDKTKLLSLSLAAQLFRELPDPTPEPEPLTLRGLVEKHECLRQSVRYVDGPTGTPWRWDSGLARFTMAAEEIMPVVRGIVKRKCDERNAKVGNWNRNWSWAPNTQGGWAINDNKDCEGPFTTELEALDALLRAMEAQQ
jgi:hypothetical protein